MVYVYLFGSLHFCISQLIFSVIFLWNYYYTRLLLFY